MHKSSQGSVQLCLKGAFGSAGYFQLGIIIFAASFSITMKIA